MTELNQHRLKTAQIAINSAYERVSKSEIYPALEELRRATAALQTLECSERTLSEPIIST